MPLFSSGLWLLFRLPILYPISFTSCTGKTEQIRTSSPLTYSFFLFFLIASTGSFSSTPETLYAFCCSSSKASSTVETHLLRASSNSNSVPSSVTRTNLLSSLEKDIRSSASNSEGSEGKATVGPGDGLGASLCSMVVDVLWVVGF